MAIPVRCFGIVVPLWLLAVQSGSYRVETASSLEEDKAGAVGKDSGARCCQCKSGTIVFSASGCCRKCDGSIKEARRFGNPADCGPGDTAVPAIAKICASGCLAFFTGKITNASHETMTHIPDCPSAGSESEMPEIAVEISKCMTFYDAASCPVEGCIWKGASCVDSETGRKWTSKSSETCKEDLRHTIKKIGVQGFFAAALNWKFESPGSSRKWNIKKQLKKNASMVPMFNDHLFDESTNQFTWPWFAVSAPEQPFPWGRVMTKEMYQLERDRLNMTRLIKENKNNVIYDIKPGLNICSLSLTTLKVVFKTYAFNDGIRWYTPSCFNVDTPALNKQIHHAMHDVCYKACYEPLARLIDKLNFECASYNESAHNAESTVKLWTELISSNPSCANTPPDLLQEMGEYIMERKCLAFHRPYLLYEVDDKEVGSFSQQPMSAGGYDPVCQLNATSGGGRPKEFKSKHDWEYGMQKGVCPSGTRCKCPHTRIHDYDTVKDYRGNGARIFFDYSLSGTQNRFTVPGVILSGVNDLIFVSTVFYGLPMLILGAPLIVPSASGFVIGMVLGTLFNSIESLGWTCEESLGCWPGGFVKIKNVGCRFKSNTKHGGSPIWFLPPPLTKMRKDWTHKCTLDKCTGEEAYQQKIGNNDFKNTPKGKGRYSLYNCQPLSYEDMTSAQKKEIWNRLSDDFLAEHQAVRPTF